MSLDRDKCVEWFQENVSYDSSFVFSAQNPTRYRSHLFPFKRGIGKKKIEFDEIRAIKSFKKKALRVCRANFPDHSISFNFKNESYHAPEEKRYAISLSGIVDRRVAIGYGYDLSLGLLYHEFSHGWFTTQEKLNAMRERAKAKYGDNYKPKLFHDIWNTLEDTRIESLCLKKYPDLAAFMSVTRYYYFGLKFEESVEETTDKVKITLADILEALELDPFTTKEQKEKVRKHYTAVHNINTIKADIHRLVRGSMSFDENMEPNEVSYPFLEKIMERKPYPLNEDELISLVEEIYEGLIPWIEDLMPDDDKFLGSFVGSSDDLLPGVGKTSDEEAPYPDLEESFPPRSEDNREYGDLYLDEVTEDLVIGDQPTIEETNGLSTAVFYSDPSYADVNRYNEIKREMKSEISVLRRSLHVLSFKEKRIQKSSTYGKLDRSKFAQALSGANNIYIGDREVRMDDFFLAILADESGSMDDKVATMRKMLVTLYEAFFDCNPVSLYMYGHTADCVTKEDLEAIENSDAPPTNIIRYFEQSNHFSAKESLAMSRARANNRDGVAIYEVAKRVRSQEPSKPGIMFVISDGEPSAGDSVYGEWLGQKGIQHTKECVLAAQKDFNMTIFHVAIEPEVPSEKMFPNNQYVKFTDMRTFTKEMSNLVLKYAKTKVSR